MARNETLANLITRAYELAGIPEPANETAGYIIKPQMRRFLNEGIGLYYRTLVSCSPDWVEREVDVSVVAGTATYSLPSDFWKIRSVGVLYNGRIIPMRRYMSSERYQYQTARQIPDWRYRIVDSGIRLTGEVQFRVRPDPQTGATVTVYYIPNAPRLNTDGTDDTEQLDGVVGWDEVIVLHATIRAKEKQEEDVADLKDDLGVLLGEIGVDATDRDEGEPKRVRDVELDLINSDLWLR